MDTKLRSTDTPEARSAAVAEAAMILQSGEPVALPTETVYGLAANALQPNAVLKIFEAKERPFFDPLICHLPDVSWLERLCEIPDESRPLVDQLASRFWPGPLTMVLPRREGVVPDVVTSGMPSVAVRMSKHPIFREVCTTFGGPLAAPSANRFGRISPTTGTHVLSELGGRIPLILEGGPTEHGLESTIVKVNGETLEILRTGPITPEMLGELAPITTPASAVPASAKAIPEAPGQLESHYAPRTRMILREAGLPVPCDPTRTGILAWAGRDYDQAGYARVEILSPAGDLREAAATLFAKMRRLDEAGLDLILADLVPAEGLGLAILDRLRRAAAPRG